MASATGGRFIIGPQAPSTTAFTVSINDGINGVTPPVPGDFNIEVFTAAATLPAPDAGFQASILDPGGTLVTVGTGSALSGSNLTLGSGDYVITDTPTISGRAAASITLGTGNQRVVGAGGDTLIGGAAGNQILDAIQQFAGGPETIGGGGGPDTIFGGPGDSVVGGTNTYIDGTAGQMTIASGSAASGADTIFGTFAKNTISGAAAGPDTFTGGTGAVYIQNLGKGDIVNFANQTGNATINANTAGNATPFAGGVSVTLGAGLGTVYGGVGDTINLGSVGQAVTGGPGKMTITDGSGGTDSVFGSSVAGGGDTIFGGNATLDFNPQTGGGGDLLNLAASSGNATINTFHVGPPGGADVANVNDTIMAGTGSDSVWGGQGDRIGVGNATSAGGSHLFSHSTSIVGAAMAFGTDDAVTTAGGNSKATVTVTNFASGTDTLFYQNETSATNASIVLTATTVQVVTPFGAGTQITMPDGTQMILVGFKSTDLVALNSSGKLFA
jgi:hypothetical protein